MSFKQQRESSSNAELIPLNYSQTTKEADNLHFNSNRLLYNPKHFFYSRVTQRKCSVDVSFTSVNINLCNAAPF